MAFKLGRQARNDGSFNARTPDEPLGFIGGQSNSGNINTTPLQDGTLAEANMDGSISVDPEVDLNSPFGKRLLKHEKKHLEQIENGDAAYDDNWVMWHGKLYIRQDWYIDGPNGKFEEGDERHPWEQEAINAEKKK